MGVLHSSLEPYKAPTRSAINCPSWSISSLNVNAFKSVQENQRFHRMPDSVGISSDVSKNFFIKEHQLNAPTIAEVYLDD